MTSACARTHAFMQGPLTASDLEKHHQSKLFFLQHPLLKQECHSGLGAVEKSISTGFQVFVQLKYMYAVRLSSNKP